MHLICFASRALSIQLHECNENCQVQFILPFQDLPVLSFPDSRSQMFDFMHLHLDIWASFDDLLRGFTGVLFKVLGEKTTKFCNFGFEAVVSLAPRVSWI